MQNYIHTCRWIHTHENTNTKLKLPDGWLGGTLKSASDKWIVDLMSFDSSSLRQESITYCLTTEMHSEKKVARQFCHSPDILECTSTNQWCWHTHTTIMGKVHHWLECWCVACDCNNMIPRSYTLYSFHSASSGLPGSFCLSPLF